MQNARTSNAAVENEKKDDLLIPFLSNVCILLACYIAYSSMHLTINKIEACKEIGATTLAQCDAMKAEKVQN